MNDKGNVFAFGKNFKGSLGIEEDQVDVPKQVPGLSNIVKMSMGTFHTLALDSSGQVWSAGANNHGQLGRDGADVPFNRFGKMKQNVAYQDICAGNSVSYLIESETNALHFCGKQEGKKNQAGLIVHPFFKSVPVAQVDCG